MFSSKLYTFTGGKKHGSPWLGWYRWPIEIDAWPGFTYQKWGFSMANCECHNQRLPDTWPSQSVDRFARPSAWRRKQLICGIHGTKKHGVRWVKSWNHPWLGMIYTFIPPIKMVIWGIGCDCFTHIIWDMNGYSGIIWRFPFSHGG